MKAWKLLQKKTGLKSIRSLIRTPAPPYNRFVLISDFSSWASLVHHYRKRFRSIVLFRNFFLVQFPVGPHALQSPFPLCEWSFKQKSDPWPSVRRSVARARWSRAAGDDWFKKFWAISLAGSHPVSWTRKTGHNSGTRCGAAPPGPGGRVKTLLDSERPAPTRCGARGHS